MTASPETWKLFLKRAIQRQRLGHALLLVSEDEIARAQAAHYFAKLLLCQNQTIKDFAYACETCSDCTQITLNRHVNIEWVGDLKEGIRIDQIREVREQLRLRAFSDKPRLIVLDYANSMTGGAANALLKSLEEPSANQYFLLLASSRLSLLKTIASRCQTIFIPPRSQALRSEAPVEMERFAEGIVSRIRQGETAVRSTLVDEIMKKCEDKSQFLLLVQRQLHSEIRKTRMNTSSKSRNETFKCIEATELSRSLLERNTNAQLTLENWLLNLWPQASK